MKTKAKKGDIIKIVALDNGVGEPSAFEGSYKIGDYMKVEKVDFSEDFKEVTTTECGSYLYNHEFEVIKIKKRKNKL